MFVGDVKTKVSEPSVTTSIFWHLEKLTHKLLVVFTWTFAVFAVSAELSEGFLLCCITQFA
jgi:hypothetical protein